MGSPTNGKCPTSWIHHRYVIAGGRCVSDGITTSDITSQTNGPYAAATFTTPTGASSCRRIHSDRITMNWNTADHPNATPTCISTPIIAVCVPPSSALGPINVDATP